MKGHVRGHAREDREVTREQRHEVTREKREVTWREEKKRKKERKGRGPYSAGDGAVEVCGAVVPELELRVAGGINVIPNGVDAGAVLLARRVRQLT
eukprot:1131766-Rhodomonas_salina.1